MKGKPPATGNPRGRGSYNPACDICARKRIKCDGIKPVCQPCRQVGRELECAWTKNPVRKPRTEQHFEAMHKRAENLRARVDEYRQYADHLESLLDQYQQDYHPQRSVDFRASRPSDADGLLGPSTSADLDYDFDFSVTGADDSDASPESDPTKEIRLPTQSLQIKEGGLIHHYGNTAPFRFEHLKLLKQPSRFPALADNPDATYVLLIDGVSDEHYNPAFDWSRHLPQEVPLDRRSHDKALDLLFKFFTSWCLRIVPGLFLRDMYRALSAPASHPPPKTPHYSPMLHNALVALGLAFLDEHRFRDLKARQYFANAAKGYIEAECRKPNLSVVHALSILASFHSSQGDQTLGYLYFGMSARMAQALGLNIDCSEWVKLGLIEESDRLDRQWANWTTLTQDVCWSLYVGRDFCVPAPTNAELAKELSMPFVDSELDQMPWVHTPAGIEPQPNYLTKTFEATCELLMISRRIMDVINGLNRSRSRPLVVDELISDIDLKLNTWRGALPPELEVTVKSRPTATPHKLMLHVAYWWLFILLHRPFFHRKERPINISDKEIDHVKLCRRAAENIMELLSTWRSLYGLRYCPITLIQAVFSAGTVYLLTAMQAGSGIRRAQKELKHSLGQQKLVLQYLNEIGKSWQCATNIAGILNGLMNEQLKPVLERKSIATTSLSGGGLLVPDYNGDDDDDTHSTHSRSSSKGLVRGHSLASKVKRSQLSPSRHHSVSQASPVQVSMSPTVTISPVQQAEPTHASPSTVQPTSSPNVIQTPPVSASFFSSSSSSLPDPWGLRPNTVHTGSPSPSSSPIFSTNDSSSSFANRPAFQGYPQLFSYSSPEDPTFWSDSPVRVPSDAFNEQDIDFGQYGRKSSSGSLDYPEKELNGFLGMLGGQTLSEVPFMPFSLGDTVAPFGTTALDTSFVSTSSLTPFGHNLHTQAPTLASFGSHSIVDHAANMDDSADWEMWAQTFESYRDVLVDPMEIDSAPLEASQHAQQYGSQPDTSKSQSRLRELGGEYMEGIEIVNCWIAAEHALSHIQKNRPQIDSAFSDSGIQKAQYVVLAGFDESIIQDGIGYLEQIHIFTSVDIAANSSLLTQLGKIMSPFSSVLFTEFSRPHRLPVFKSDGNMWDFDELVFETASKFADCGSTAARYPTVISLSQSSASGGIPGFNGFGESSGPGREKSGDEPERRDNGRDGEEDKNGDKRDQDQEGDPDDPEGPGDEAQGQSDPNVVCFDVSSGLHLNDHSELFQLLTVDGALTIQFEKHPRATEFHVRFTKLNFGTMRTQQTAYEQFFLRVTVDPREQDASVNIVKPLQTWTKDKGSKVMSTSKSGWTASASAAATVALMPLKSQATFGATAGRTGENSISAEQTQYSSQINPQTYFGIASCGFSIDDPSHRQGGIKMPDSILPAIDFKFLDSPTFSNPILAPSTIDVEIKSYWSVISHGEQGFPWISGIFSTSKEAVSPYSNLCQVVFLEIPSRLTKPADYKAQLLVNIKDLDRGYFTDVRFEDGPVGFRVTPAVSRSSGSDPASLKRGDWNNSCALSLRLPTIKYLTGTNEVLAKYRSN